MKKIVIASACRTAIGKFGGTLANVFPARGALGKEVLFSMKLICV